VPPLRIAILVAARNEADVIERKVVWTDRLAFPPLPGGLAHLAVIVDDGSSDGTAERARAAVARCAKRADLQWRVVANRRRAGKGGALLTGFDEAEGYDLVAMTDADAITTTDAPVATARRFEADARLGALSGTQRYARAIGAHGPDGDARDLYDRLSERARAAESRFGALFSVHGPWLVVRASSGARPIEGVGADDLDVALAVRRAGLRVELAKEIVCFEVKPQGTALAEQRLRRARAFFEAMDRNLAGAARTAPVPWGALQVAAYAFGPPLLAMAFFALAAAPAAAAWIASGRAAMGLAAALATAALLVWPPFPTCARYAAVILRARFSRPRARADQWQPVVR